ncbi:MAG: O-antigen ligase family protein [Candidatus Dormibacteraeota bacterium]|nr:O-antigen ligase family protein [Candidatus Dormibacteraeota bacterium]
MAALIVGGISLGIGLAGAPANLVLGTLAALLALGATIYRPALGLAVLMFTYPFDLTTFVGPVKVTTSYALFAILIAVWVAREILPNPPKWQRTSLDWPVVLFAVATFLSLLGLTGNYTDQLVALLKATGGFVLFFIATQSLRSRGDVWLVVGAVLATGLIQSVETILPVVNGTVVVSDATRATGTVNEANDFAGYLVLVGPLAVAAGLTLRHRWLTIAGGLGTLLFGAALVATLSRSGWIGIVVAVIALAVLLPQRRRQIAMIGGGVLAVLLIGGLAGPIADRLGNQAGSSPLDTFLARVPIWSAALAIFVQHPIFGIGVDQFQNMIDSFNPDLGVNQAHNLFLNMAAERGVLGFGTFVALVVMLFKVLRSALRSALSFPYRVLAAGLIASFLGFFAHSQFDVSYYDYKILLMFWFLVGLAATLTSLQNSPVTTTEAARG